MSKQEFLQYKGKVKTLLKNAMFEVELENGHTVTAHTAEGFAKIEFEYYKVMMLLVNLAVRFDKGANYL